MGKAGDTLIILTPAFAESEGDTWLPAQEAFVRMLNRRFPQLRIVILTFHFPATGPATYQWYGNEMIAFGGAMKGGWRSPWLWSRVSAAAEPAQTDKKPHWPVQLFLL